MKRSKKTYIVTVLLGLSLLGLGAFSGTALTQESSDVPACGQPSAESVPCIVSAHRDAEVPLKEGVNRLGALTVRPGDWFFIAKVVLTTTGGPFSPECTLTAGDSRDVAKVVLPPNQSNTATMTLVHSFGSRGKAVVTCDTPSGTAQTASWLRITAIRAGTLFDSQIS